MKALKGLAVALLLAVIPLAGVAQETRKVLNPWVDCGIGAMIFTETGWAAAISNVIWDLGTTAITSDYSSQNACGSKKAQTAMFIGTVYANLADDLAKGDGKHVRTMLAVRGCSVQSHDAIVASLRPAFARSLSDAAYAAQTSTAKAQALYEMLENDISASHAGACSA